MKKKNIIIITIILISIIIISIAGYFVAQKIQEENRKYEIETISEYKYFVLKENDKYGVIDTKGNKIIETKYDDVKIPNPQKDVFICYENDKTKVINEKGEEIYSEYENIEPLRLKNILSDLMYEKTILKYSQNGKYGIIDINGKKVTNAIYDEIDTLQTKEGELLVKKEGKYGVINIKGATLVKPQYDKIEADKFYEEGNSYKKAGYIVSKTTEEGYRYGYVNLDGKEIIEVKYNDLYRITDINSDNIYIICAENGKYGLLKNNQKIIDNEYQSLFYNESNNTITALKGKNYGVISIDGKVIIPFEYQQIDITGDYIYAKTNDENVKIFDASGTETSMNENTAIINIDNTEYKIYIETTDEKTTYSIYKNKQKITQNEYTYIQYLYDNYFIACNNDGKLGVIDDTEKTKIEFNYSSIQKIENTSMIQTLNNEQKITEIYSKDMKKITELKNATIQNDKEYLKIYNEDETKYISNEEKEVTNTEIFANNKIFAQKQDDKWGFVDASGTKIVDYKYDKVTELNKYGFAGIKQNDKWGVINADGKVIVEPTYKLSDNEPTFIGQYYKVVYGNGEIYYTK